MKSKTTEELKKELAKGYKANAKLDKEIVEEWEPTVDMGFVGTWAKEFASLEFLPLVPLCTGDKFMPAYIIKVKNMLIEAGVKIKE